MISSDRSDNIADSNVTIVSGGWNNTSGGIVICSGHPRNDWLIVIDTTSQALAVAVQAAVMAAVTEAT